MKDDFVIRLVSTIIGITEKLATRFYGFLQVLLPLYLRNHGVPRVPPLPYPRYQGFPQIPTPAALIPRDH